MPRCAASEWILSGGAHAHAPAAEAQKCEKRGIDGDRRLATSAADQNEMSRAAEQHKRGIGSRRAPALGYCCCADQMQQPPAPRMRMPSATVVRIAASTISPVILRMRKM